MKEYLPKGVVEDDGGAPIMAHRLEYLRDARRFAYDLGAFWV
jgi:hypothetical protein